MADFVIALGLLVAAGTASVLLWSVFQPDRRIWPPKRYTSFTPILVWGPTLTLFGSLILLGILEWGEWPLHWALRFGLGGALVVLGNIGVWFEVARFGIAQTGGEKGCLKTDGLYRYSRNPQYVADIVMVLGWILLAASPSVVLVGTATIALLIIAPFAEEPWLAEQYGEAFDTYRRKVRRFV